MEILNAGDGSIYAMAAKGTVCGCGCKNGKGCGCGCNCNNGSGCGCARTCS